MINKSERIVPFKNIQGKELTFKIISIAILSLLLLVPKVLVQDLIQERQSLQENTQWKVFADWSGAQTIVGPIVSIPIKKRILKEEKWIEIPSVYHILPEKLDLKVEISPKTLHKGIFEIIVYSAKFQIEVAFRELNSEYLEPFDEVVFQNAFLTLGLSDLRGVKDAFNLSIQGKKLDPVPGSKIPDLIPSGLSFPFELDNISDLNQDFSMEFELQGSYSLNIIPTGKMTIVNMHSDWSSPSFIGNFLPDERTISNQDFNANWKILQINRNYPQQWEKNRFKEQMNQSAFGVELINPADHYQKTNRSVKYALLTITFCFMTLFIIEVSSKIRIHFIQYAMVGSAILIFYALLLSFSEYIGFDKAFFLSAGIVISMIYLYSLAFLRNLKYSIYLLLLCAINYGLIYFILQLSEFALLAGVIVLTIVLGAVMFITGKINHAPGNESEF